MKSKEEVRTIIENAPSAKAYHKERRPIGNDTLGRVFAWLLILCGGACLFLTQQVYRLLPFLLGGLLTVTGVNHAACGLWTREYETRDTKLTANGIVYALLGLVMLFHHDNADAVIGSIWGVLGLMKGSEALNDALYSMARKERFLARGAEAAIELALAFLLLVDPSSSVQHHVFLLGLELAAVGWETLRELRKDK